MKSETELLFPSTGPRSSEKRNTILQLLRIGVSVKGQNQSNTTSRILHVTCAMHTYSDIQVVIIELKMF